MVASPVTPCFCNVVGVSEAARAYALHWHTWLLAAPVPASVGFQTHAGAVVHRLSTESRCVSDSQHADESRVPAYLHVTSTDPRCPTRPLTEQRTIQHNLVGVSATAGARSIKHPGISARSSVLGCRSRPRRSVVLQHRTGILRARIASLVTSAWVSTSVSHCTHCLRVSIALLPPPALVCVSAATAVRAAWRARNPPASPSDGASVHASTAR